MSYACVSVPSVTTSTTSPMAGAASQVRYERGKAVRLFSVMTFPHMLLGGMVVCAGIVTVYIESLSPVFPFVIGTDILSGLTTVFTGGLAYKVSKENIYRKHLRSRAKCNVFLYGFLCIVCACLSLLSVGAAGYRTYLCTLGASVHARDQSTPYRACQTRREASLAMSITDIVLESFLCAVSILGFWIFANYRFAFGCFTSCDKVSKRPAGKSGDRRRQENHLTRSLTRQTVSSIDSSKLTSITDAQLRNALLPVSNRIPRVHALSQASDDMVSRISFERPAQRFLSSRDLSRSRPQAHRNLASSNYSLDDMMLRRMRGDLYGRTQEHNTRSLYRDVLNTQATDYSDNVGLYRNRPADLLDVANCYSEYSRNRFTKSGVGNTCAFYNPVYSEISRLPNAYTYSDTWCG